MTTDEERNLDNLVRLKRALKAVAKSVNQALMTGTYEGLGDMAITNYQRLHAKAKELYPDDFFIESLDLQISPGADDRAKLSQVQMLVNQLASYVDSMMKEERVVWSAEMDDLRSLGTELRDQIINVTRRTLRNALANIDFGDVPEPPEPPLPPDPPGKPKRRIKVEVIRDDEDMVTGDDEPPYRA
jgi:hypothetical protein